MPGHLFEGNPVSEGTTRRGTDTTVHHPEKPAGSTHSSTRGLRLPEQLERQPEFHSPEANAWLFCTAGAIPKPVLGKCQKYPWGLVKYGLFTDSTPGLRRPRSRPRLGIFNQSPLVTLMETHRVHSAPGWTPSCPVLPPMEPSSLSSEDVSLLLPQEKPSAFCSCTTGLSEGRRAQGQPQIWICSLI